MMMIIIIFIVIIATFRAIIVITNISHILLDGTIIDPFVIIGIVNDISAAFIYVNVGRCRGWRRCRCLRRLLLLLLLHHNRFLFAWRDDGHTAAINVFLT